MKCLQNRIKEHSLILWIILNYKSCRPINMTYISGHHIYIYIRHSFHMKEFFKLICN